MAAVVPQGGGSAAPIRVAIGLRNIAIELQRIAATVGHAADLIDSLAVQLELWLKAGGGLK